MIEKFNAWMEKVGVDKILHFFVAAWLVAECKVLGFNVALLAFLVVSVLAVVKELYIDEESDLKDAWVSVLGGVVSLVLYLL